MFVKATYFFFTDYKDLFTQAEVTLFANIIVWFAFLNILHLMLKGLFAFLSVQMYLDIPVSFFFLWFRKDDIWFLYPSLKLVASST